MGEEGAVYVRVRCWGKEEGGGRKEEVEAAQLWKPELHPSLGLLDLGLEGRSA